MLAYPQMESGVIGQFPIRKLRRMRTVTNATEDGKTYKYSDHSGEMTEWELQYTGLTDGEAATMATFFESAEGRLQGFTFVDPTANLLAWSERLDEDVWDRDSYLTVQGSAADPTGGTAAWRLTNSGGAAQALWQTVEAPAGYAYCFSAYLRSTVPTGLELLSGERRVSATAHPTWNRVYAGATGNPEGERTKFGIELPPGASVEIFGLQAEAQLGASAYKRTTRGGVYHGARFGQDELRIRTTGVNQHECRVTIIHANHL